DVSLLNETKATNIVAIVKSNKNTQLNQPNTFSANLLTGRLTCIYCSPDMYLQLLILLVKSLYRKQMKITTNFLYFNNILKFKNFSLYSLSVFCPKSS